MRQHHEPPSGATRYLYEGSSGSLGITAVKPAFEFWVSLKDSATWCFSIARPSLAFSASERKFLGSLPSVLAGLFVASDNPGSKRVHHRLGGQLSFEHLLVAQVLRRQRGGGLWTPLLIMQALIDLSFKKYEGTPATSGIVYTSQPQLYIPRLEHSAFQFQSFDQSVEFTREFFAYPASHRYVDGRNSFYLVNNLRQTLGVVRARDPREFGIVERCGGVHVTTLLEKMPGRAWVAYVGLTQDVHVITAQGVRLRWDSNHWYMRDDGLLARVLRDAGCNERTAEDLTSVLYALSELRMGTAVLIPREIGDRPPVAGQIDPSPLGDSLRSQFEGGSLADLIQSHAAIGVFSSDGLTTVATDGVLLGCGEIIELGNRGVAQGGGRSQAALKASACGTAIKVSEDGPISVYREGKMLIRL